MIFHDQVTASTAASHGVERESSGSDNCDAEIDEVGDSNATPVNLIHKSASPVPYSTKSIETCQLRTLFEHI